jgi:acetyl-CoA carboxylase biotin carboxyl carrier protein
MTFKEIQELIKLVDKSTLAEVKIKVGDVEVSLRGQHYFDSKRQPAMVYQGAPLQAPVQSTPVQSSAAPAPASAPQADLPAAEKAAAPAAGLIEIKSPMVGTFYRSASPDKPPYAQVGDEVKAGSVVCIVEAMKLFNEIESEISGKIVKVLVEDASPVEYDQPLFLVDPKG